MTEKKIKTTLESKSQKKGIDDLLKVMAQLRDPKTGCVWDKAQTYESVLPHTIEETYEVVEAIRTENFENLPNELGDLLFQVVFYAQIAKEEGRFDFSDVTNAITEKMIRRHPHVFAGEQVDSIEAQAQLWNKIKQAENKTASKTTLQTQARADEKSALAGINKYQPAINIACRLQKKAAKVGFDWPSLDGPLDKIAEEFDEVKEAISGGNKAEIKDELGDLFFAVVNLSRHLGVDPDDAIASTNKKFETRFKAMEALANKKNVTFSELSLDEQEAYWVNVKNDENNKT